MDGLKPTSIADLEKTRDEIHASIAAAEIETDAIREKIASLVAPLREDLAAIASMRGGLDRRDPMQSQEARMLQALIGFGDVLTRIANVIIDPKEVRDAKAAETPVPSSEDPSMLQTVSLRPVKT